MRIFSGTEIGNQVGINMKMFCCFIYCGEQCLLQHVLLPWCVFFAGLQNIHFVSLERCSQNMLG